MQNDFNQSLKTVEQLRSIKIIVGDSALKNEQQIAKTYIDLHQLLYAIKTGQFGDLNTANIDKAHRPVISQSTIYARPKQQNAHYLSWSGFQPIDLDFKYNELIPYLKPKLHQMLCKYPWYVGLASSTSGNGLHVYTASKPMNAIKDHLPSVDDFLKAKQLYYDAFEQKAIVTWKCLIMCSEYFESINDHEFAVQTHPIHNTMSRRQDKAGQMSESNVLDASVCKISQLLYLTYDPQILVNENFTLLELPELDMKIYGDVSTGGSDNRFNLHILKEKFDKLRSRFKFKPGTQATNNVTDGDTQFTQRGDIIMLQEGTFATITPQNYDNTMRYRMAYTLAWLYDLQDINTGVAQNVLSLYLQMCSGNPKFDREHNAWAKSFASAVERNRHGSAPCVWSAIKELRDKHGYKFRIANKTEYAVQELVAEHNTEDKIKEYIMSALPRNEVFDLKYTHIIDLKDDEYLSIYKQELEQTFEQGLNFLIARPGSGKTEFIKQLTRDGRRVLLVEPYTSILQSKIEPSDLDFYCSYAEKQLECSKHLNVACTFDKFTRIDPEEASILYDYIVVDESHLLTMSAYRDVVPANVIDKLSQLHTKVICMTGTPVSEHMFLKFKTITLVRKPLDHNKYITFVCCQHDGDKIAKIACQITNTLKHGGKVLFPTNRGDVYTQAILGTVKLLLGRSPKVRYYKKDNQLHDFVRNINEKGTLGDVELLFCTNYLSVGIDINDNINFDVIYDESFTAQEIEQFNSRLRRVAIRSFVYFSMLNSKGEVKNITAYKELDLTLTNLDQVTFWDMLQINTKRDSISKLYDFFAWAFKMPYFYRDEFTGEIQVHLTCYKLFMFEDKWREWCSQLRVVQNILTSYGYSCNIIDDPVVEDLLLERVLQAAREARAEYRLQKNLKLQKMFASFKNQRVFDEILNLSPRDIIESDRWELVNNKKQKHVQYCVEDKRLFEDWRRWLRHLSSFYSYNMIRNIIDYYVIDDKGMYRQAKLKAINDAVSIFNASTTDSMHQSNVKVVKYFIDDVLQSNENVIRIDSDTIDGLMTNAANIYFESIGYNAVSPDVRSNTENIARRLWNVITVHDKDLYAIRTLPPFDSGYSRNRDTLQRILNQLFKTDIFEDRTEKLIEAAKLRTTITTLVFGNEQTNLPISDTNIVSLKFVDTKNDFDLLETLPEYEPEHTNGTNTVTNTSTKHNTTKQFAYEPSSETLTYLSDLADNLLADKIDDI